MTTNGTVPSSVCNVCPNGRENSEEHKERTMKRKPDISGRQISTTASSAKAARIDFAGASKQVGGKPLVTIFMCPNGHRKLLTRMQLNEDTEPKEDDSMYDKLPIGQELHDLKAKYENTWAGLPEVAAMPREFEAVGGLLAGMVLGGGTGDVFGPRGEGGQYFVVAAEEEESEGGDFEAVMMFFAGKLAMALMCGTGPGVYPLSAFSIRLAARIAREFLGNLPEILRLARQLKREGQIGRDDVGEWTRSSEGAVGVSADKGAGVPEGNG